MSGGISFQQMMAGMTFRQFVVAFGTLLRVGEPWEPEPEVRKYRPWRLWKGWEGNPGQPDVADMLPSVRIFRSPKARQKGMTEMWAMYCAYVLMREGKVNAKAFGSDTKQTKEIMELRFKTKIEGMMEVYPEIPWPRWEIGVERADNLDNGSYFQVYSSENTGAHGGTPRLTLFDEAQNYASSDFREMMKGIGPSLNGANQLAILGTARSGSAFNESISLTMKRVPEIGKNIWRSEDRTSDDRYWSAGMIFLNDDLDPSHRSAAWKENQLNEIFGGDTIAFKSQHPDTILDMFASHEGLVVSSWDTPRHVVELPVEWKPHHEFYLVYDHGSTQSHPAVALFIHYDPWLDFVYVFDEVFIRGRELAFVASEIVRKLAEWRKQWHGGGPRVRPYGDVRGRYGARQVDEILREETGLDFIGVNKQDEAAKIELMKIRHFRGRGADRRGGIAYSPRCAQSVKQISSWRYKEGKDVPADLEQDAADALKYALHEIYSREPTPEPTYMEKHHAMIRQWKAAATRPTGPVAEIDPLRECLRSG